MVCEKNQKLRARMDGDNYSLTPPKRGDVFLVDLFPSIGCEQSGIRPVVIVQNNVGNKYSPTVIAAPLTNGKKSDMATHVKIPAICRQASEKGLTSTILLEQIRVLDKSRLQNKLGEIDAEAMDKVDEAIRVSLGLSESWR